MKINWKRVVIAGIWAELLLGAIYFPARQYAGSAFPAIAVVAMIGSMLLGALWAAGRIDSRFVLHGVLVGIAANVLFYVLFFSLRSVLMSDQPSGSVANHLLDAALKVLGGALGGYVGRIRRKKLLSAQAGKS
jgi:putative membrane protein (TIGR04086 family)